MRLKGPFRTFASNACEIGQAVQDLQAVCIKAADDAKARGVRLEKPPSWSTGETLSQFEKRCWDYCEIADNTKGPKPIPPAPVPLARAEPIPAAPVPLARALPEVTGNEAWRAAVERWETNAVSAAALLSVPPAKAPGTRFDVEKEDIKKPLDQTYFAARIERLRFEIKRCSGQTMKAFEPTPPTLGRGYGRNAVTHTDDRHRMWSYAHELQSHLSVLLSALPDKALAAQIRASNFQK